MEGAKYGRCSPLYLVTDRARALDDAAGELRERLVRDAGQEGGEAPARIAALVERDAALLSEPEREELRRRVAQRAFGLGPLEPLLADPSVDEVMVNGVGGAVSVWVERRGRIEPTDVVFASVEELRHAIERILAPLGRRVDEAAPLCDARLPDGSRVNVVIPPLALDGPVLTIRRFRRSGFGPEDLVAAGTIDPSLRDLLRACVRARLTLLVSGGTGSGKTTTLGALSSFIPDGERIVTIEDAAELRLRQPHVVRLEARPASLEGRGEVTIRRLVRNALRMRPDRIVVGEVRGGEALDMLSAMASGHDGSLSTVHAGSAEEALRRIETLALMADVALPHAAIREQVAGAIDVVVHQRRERDGSRRVVSVCEVVRTAGGVGTRELYSRRGERAAWRAPLPAELAERLEAAGWSGGGAGGGGVVAGGAAGGVAAGGAAGGVAAGGAAGGTADGVAAGGAVGGVAAGGAAGGGVS
ncbi:CpaF family protein [Conexibacter woesei]|uniref:CpaF family protein n=1 Tax=Conexibacter woesei TaxID=191495 RepID=UPI000324F1C0|nr:CpaF family protein [Conexibacter woesei]